MAVLIALGLVDHEDDAVLLRGGDHAGGLFQRIRDRLLNKYVLSGFRGLGRDRCVQVVWQAQVDDLHLGICKSLRH